MNASAPAASARRAAATRTWQARCIHKGVQGDVNARRGAGARGARHQPPLEASRQRRRGRAERTRVREGAKVRKLLKGEPWRGCAGIETRLGEARVDGVRPLRRAPPTPRRASPPERAAPAGGRCYQQSPQCASPVPQRRPPPQTPQPPAPRSRHPSSSSPPSTRTSPAVQQPLARASLKYSVPAYRFVARSRTLPSQPPETAHNAGSPSTKGQGRITKGRGLCTAGFARNLRKRAARNAAAPGQRLQAPPPCGTCAKAPSQPYPGMASVWKIPAYARCKHPRRRDALLW